MQNVACLLLAFHDWVMTGGCISLEVVDEHFSRIHGGPKGFGTSSP